jgi:hypothetical protein
VLFAKYQGGCDGRGCSMNGGERNACRMLESQKKETTKKTKTKVGCQLKMDHREIRWGGVEWIDLA